MSWDEVVQARNETYDLRELYKNGQITDEEFAEQRIILDRKLIRLTESHLRSHGVL